MKKASAPGRGSSSASTIGRTLSSVGSLLAISDSMPFWWDSTRVRNCDLPELYAVASPRTAQKGSRQHRAFDDAELSPFLICRIVAWVLLGRE